MEREREGGRGIDRGKEEWRRRGRGDLPLDGSDLTFARPTDRVSRANIVSLLLSCLRERASEPGAERG